MTSADAATDEPKTFRCRVCGREFENREELEKHVRDTGLLW